MILPLQPKGVNIHLYTVFLLSIRLIKSNVNWMSKDIHSSLSSTEYLLSEIWESC